MLQNHLGKPASNLKTKETKSLGGEAWVSEFVKAP